MKRSSALPAFICKRKERRFGILPGCASFCLLLMLFFFASGVNANTQAKEAAIRDLMVTNSREALLLYCTVANGFSPEMEHGIANGIPATFTFFVELHQVRTRWPDKKLATLSFEHTMTFDPLKEEYHIDVTEQGGKNITVGDSREARVRLAEVGGVEVAQLSLLIPDASYEIRVRARLHQKDPPFFVRYLLPLGALWDVTTGWQTLRFRY